MTNVLTRYGTMETSKKAQRVDFAFDCRGSTYITWPSARKDAMTCDNAWLPEDSAKGLRVDTRLNVPIAVAVRHEDFRV